MPSSRKTTADPEGTSKCPSPKLSGGPLRTKADTRALTNYLKCEVDRLTSNQANLQTSVVGTIRDATEEAVARTESKCAAVLKHVDAQALHLTSDSGLLLAAVGKAATNAVTADAVADAMIAKGFRCPCDRK